MNKIKINGIKALIDFLVKQNALEEITECYNWELETRDGRLTPKIKAFEIEQLFLFNVFREFILHNSEEVIANNQLEKDFKLHFTLENNSVRINYSSRVLLWDEPENYKILEKTPFQFQSYLSVQEFVEPYLSKYRDKSFEVLISEHYNK